MSRVLSVRSAPLQAMQSMPAVLGGLLAFTGLFLIVAWPPAGVTVFVLAAIVVVAGRYWWRWWETSFTRVTAVTGLAALLALGLLASASTATYLTRVASPWMAAGVLAGQWLIAAVLFAWRCQHHAREFGPDASQWPPDVYIDLDRNLADRFVAAPSRGQPWYFLPILGLGLNLSLLLRTHFEERQYAAVFLVGLPALLMLVLPIAAARTFVAYRAVRALERQRRRRFVIASLSSTVASGMSWRELKRAVRLADRRVRS